MNVRAGWLVWAVLGGVAFGQGGVAGQIGGPLPAGKRPMTFADLMAMKRVSDPQVSPSGKWVMFSVTEVSLEKNTKITNLWVVPMGGGGNTPMSQDRDMGQPETGKERQLTSGEVSQTGGRFSPDGKWVLLVSAGGGSSQIWTAKWDDEHGTMQKPHPLTSVATEADGAVWSPDSKRILFVSSVYPECSEKDGATDPTHRDTPAMNGAPGMAASRQVEVQASWAEEDACNKARMEAEAKNPVKAQVWDHLLYRHWNAFTGERRSHVLVVDFADGEKVRDLTPRSAVGDAETPTFSLGGPLGYAWAPDGKEIAYVTNLDKVPAASTNNDVFTLRLDDPGARAVKVSTSLGSDDGPQYSPDGRWLAFRSQARAGYESDRFRLIVMDREKKTTKEAVPVDQDSQGKIVQDLWVDEFAWSPDSKGIAYATGYHGQEVIRTVGVDDGNALHFGWQLTRAEYSDVHFVDDNTLIAAQMKVSAPSEVIIAKHERTEEEGYDIVQSSVGVKALTGVNAALLSSLSLDPLTSFYFKGAEDVDVQGFIVRPPNFDPSKKYPVKFLIHGGPQGAWGDAWSYRWNPELFAADGYVVVMVNPRGSTGYGQAFIDGVNGDWGGKAYVDLMRGLDAAEAKYPFIDKTRECALGASYGGYMANWMLTHTDRFKCIVTHDGMYNPASAYGDTEEMWFNEWEFRRPGASEPGQPWRYAAGPVSEDPFRKWSPMLSIGNAHTPTLVIHSQKDYRLDVSEGFQLFTALQRLGVPSKMLYFPDEGHWVMKPKNSELWYETVNDWCDRWTHSGKYARAEAVKAQR